MEKVKKGEGWQFFIFFIDKFKVQRIKKILKENDTFLSDILGVHYTFMFYSYMCPVTVLFQQHGNAMTKLVGGPFKINLGKVCKTSKDC